MLLIADVHLGKADTFRKFGISVPQHVQDSDLTRLKQLLLQLTPKRCVILGDFVHGRVIGSGTAENWNALVSSNLGTQFELILGNHDRSFQADLLSLSSIHSHLFLENVFLSHEPVTFKALPSRCTLNIHGHIHAAVQIDDGRRKIPALAFTPPYLCMPAFSEFTAGVQLNSHYQKIWVFSPEADLVAQIR